MRGEQDTLLRLRQEVDAVAPELRPGQVDDVLGQVFSQRARQRAQRARLWGAVAAVALVVAGTVLISDRITRQNSEIQPAVSVDHWPLRGELAGDQALLARAEQTWRDVGGPAAPSGQVRPLYAQRSAPMLVNMVLVVLSGRTADGRTAVAFVTSPAGDGVPTGDRLFVRAVDFPDPAPRALGFVAVQPDPSDAPIPDGGAVAFALAAPGAPPVAINSSMIDHDYTGAGALREAFWQILPRRVGAWNCSITTDPADGRRSPLAAGVLDPVVTAVTVNGSGAAQTARSTTDRAPVAGDLVVTPEALLGTITGADGRIDVSPTTWASYGKVSTAISNIPGTLTNGPGNALVFTPTGQGEIAEGNRLVFTSTSNPEVVVNVGRLTKADGGWRVDRGATGQTDTMSISPR